MYASNGYDCSIANSWRRSIYESKRSGSFQVCVSVLSVLMTLSLKCKHNWDELEEAPYVHEVWQFCLFYITHLMLLSYTLFTFPFQHGNGRYSLKAWIFAIKSFRWYVASYLRAKQTQQYNLPTLNDSCSEIMFYSRSKLKNFCRLKSTVWCPQQSHLFLHWSPTPMLLTLVRATLPFSHGLWTPLSLPVCSYMI